MSKQIDVRTLVDEQFYYKNYPDVRASRINATEHFLRYGRYEGRVPRKLLATDLEARLWSEEIPLKAIESLEQLACENADNSLESLFANWVLARYYKSRDRSVEAKRCIEAVINSRLRELALPTDGPLCVLVELLEGDEWAERREYFKTAFKSPLYWHLAHVMHPTDAEGASDLSKIFGISFEDTTKIEAFDDLTRVASQRKITRGPLVSVIVPSYNSSGTLKTSLLSLKQQSWRNLEVIVINDASNDDTEETFNLTVGEDSRFVMKSLNHNRGAYFARNEGLSESNGSFITVMDADDWAHPEKIERQVNALRKSPLKKASISYLVRCTDDFKFTHWNINSGWLQPNMSSLMFRRSVIKKIGYWDEARAGADTEFYNRLITRFGESAIIRVAPDIPLSFCRISEDSLTSHSTTHISSTIKGVRADYTAAFRRWHSAVKKRELYLPCHAHYRVFSAPSELLQHRDEKSFDEQWYRDAYGDVSVARVDPYKHYQKFGVKEGREPSPHTSLSAERLIKENINLLNVSKGSLPIFKGRIEYIRNRGTFIFFGHMAGDKVFGAERSLLDLLRSITEYSDRKHERNIVVVLPSLGSFEYLDTLLTFCSYIHIVPMPLWRADRGINVAVKGHIEEVIKSYQTAFCYVNTMTLWEPVEVCKANDIPFVMHVRELAGYDKNLQDLLHADSRAIGRHLNKMNCRYWANSDTTYDWLESLGIDNCTLDILRNGIDTKRLATVSSSQVRKTDDLVVGMIGNNSVKKGIKDFYKIRNSLKDSRISFKLFGDKSSLVNDRESENYQFMGYVNDPKIAYGQCDVILCLSLVQESFGRTAAEAMAAGRVVIAYDWGALGEVIGDAGILVKYRDTKAVVNELKKLVSDRELLNSYSQKARARAQMFSLETLADTFNRLSAKVIRNNKTLDNDNHESL